MIVFKAIKPATPFKSSIFRYELKSAANAMAPKILKDFEATVRTWKDKPEFTTEVNIGRAAGSYATRKLGITGGVEISVTTDDPIYRYVDEGTRVRYATMTKDFSPKTKPKILKSYKGRGGLLFVNKKRPRPGIKAREFTKTVHKKYQKDFRKEMDAAIRRAAKRSGHSVK